MPNFCGHPDGPCSIPDGEHAHHGGNKHEGFRGVFDQGRKVERMSTALAKPNVTELARQQDGLSQDQIDLIKDTIAKGASNDELQVFIMTCNRLRLDPFARQIYLVPRWDADRGKNVRTPQTSIDGFRLVAERTGGYRGQTEPQWCGKDGKWTNVWLADEPPAAARVGVHREGFAEPLVRVARYRSYAQTTKEGNPTKMWRTMPDVMLSKCAEALALRAAFPNELSGIYTSDEMDQATNEAAPKSGKAPRTLDDVATGGVPAGQPLGVNAPMSSYRSEDLDVVTGEIDWEPPLFGLTPPTLPCPTFGPRATKPLQGKRWDVHNGAWLVQQWWEDGEARNHFDDAMMAWAKHIVELRARRHAYEAKLKSDAEAAALQAEQEEAERALAQKDARD
jgi:phage recombination protein Bet